MITLVREQKLFALALGVVLIAATATGCILYKNRYPYGYSHCCIRILGFGLEQYADDHNGCYPTGEVSPEGSLSLLHFGPYNVSTETLRGKSVPLSVVEGMFRKGELLGPDSCGWHYVEGLTQNDDSDLAILWDKVGLGHCGERYNDGSREVLFVGGQTKLISSVEWPTFLMEQQQLLAKRDQFGIRGGAVLVGKIKLPDGEIVEEVASPFEMLEHNVSDSVSFDGTLRSGSSLTTSVLRWKSKELIPSNGTKTIVLSFPARHLRSRPVTIILEDGRASPSSIVFEMEVIK